MPRTATSEQVAAVLHVKPATVRKYARNHLVPFDSTPGGHRRFDVREVREALGVAAAADPASEEESTTSVVDTPFVPVPATTRRVPVRVVGVYTPPPAAHGTADEHAAWAEETPVV